MKRLILLLLCVIFAGLILFFAFGHGEESISLPQKSCNRIVSLAPSITETVYAVGLGDRVLGVTDFCTYPPEIASAERVGGVTNINYEAIVRLQPDVVFLLPDQLSVEKRLQSMGIRTFSIPYKTLEDILDSFGLVGQYCGVEDSAQKVSDSLRSRIEKVEKKSLKKRPKVLISVGRNSGTGAVTDLFIAGKRTFYDDLIRMAGGENVASGESVAYPKVSAEGIVSMNPDVVVDILAIKGIDSKAALKDWKSMDMVKAEKSGNVHVITKDYAVIPGPRIIRFFEELSKWIGSVDGDS